MAGVLMKPAIIQRAKYTLGGTADSVALTLHLFVNDYTPVCTDTTSDYTECSLAGYSDQALSYGGFTCAFDDPSCTEACTYDTLTFTFTAGGQTIYGCYVTNDATGDLWWAERWATPFVVPSGGGSVTVTPQWLDMQCP